MEDRVLPVVDQLPVPPPRRDLGDHGQDRRDADAADDEQVALGVDQREVVTGTAHVHAFG